MRRLPLWMRLGYWIPGCLPAMQTPICFYNKTLLNCLPGNCRMMPFISRLKSVARTSEEFKPERSTMSSMGFGSSALNNSYSFFSDPLSEAAASRFRSLFDQQIGGKTHRLRDVAGHSEDLPAKFHCETRGNQRTAVLCAFNHDDSERHARNNAVSHRKILRRGMRPQWKLAYDRPALQ